jgi:hypothetical protein
MDEWEIKRIINGLKRMRERERDPREKEKKSIYYTTSKKKTWSSFKQVIFGALESIIDLIFSG